MRRPATATDLERLRRLLGGEELGWPVERIRTRLERGLGLDGTVALERATPAQRRAVARLLGRPVGRGASLHVPLPAVEAVLRRGGLAPTSPRRSRRSAVQWSTAAPAVPPTPPPGPRRSPPPSRHSSATPR